VLACAAELFAAFLLSHNLSFLFVVFLFFDLFLGIASMVIASDKSHAETG